MVVEDLVPSYEVKIDFVGETITAASHVAEKRQKLKEHDGHGRKRRRKDSTTEACRWSVGTIQEAANSHISFGYSEGNPNVWTVAGHLAGTVWMTVFTNAPASRLSRIRCLGPLLSLVDIWEKDVDLGGSQSLEEATQKIQELIAGSDYSLKPALRLWEEHVRASWSFSKEQEIELSEKLAGRMSLRYRLSCLRTESKQYRYTRQQLLTSVADTIVPPLQSSNDNAVQWTVDLTEYDLEIVLLVRSHSLAVGLALRPYQHVGAKSFAAGVLPPDISPPYLSGQALSGLVRLRPSTAQVLLHLAQIQPDDVVLDPCVGIGTIVKEASFCRQPTALAFGGDLVLTPDGLGPVAVKYAKAVQKTRHELDVGSSSVGDLMAWDASILPLRSGSVDAIVSDLPFGKQCMSSSKLDGFLPLLMGELSRVLRPSSGRMVLLCGNYVTVLESLQRANDLGGENKVWELPCTAVFPVNIGGLVAWIVQVRRGPGSAARLPNHRERVQRITMKRERTAQLGTKGTEGKSKKMQS